MSLNFQKAKKMKLSDYEILQTVGTGKPKTENLSIINNNPPKKVHLAESALQKIKLQTNISQSRS